MDNNFKLYSQYYDLLYQDKDYDAETAYVVGLINTYSPASKSIVELGAGTGKHAFRLAKKGFKVLGIERSADMVGIAKKLENPQIEFQVGDITNFQVAEQFDVATSLFHVISYLTANEDLIQTFENVHAHLKPNGIFIFDVWHSSAIYHQVPEKRTKILSNQDVKVLREANPVIYPERNVVDVNYQINIQDLHTNEAQQINETHPMRHFSRPEIELLAYATGFELLHTEEFETKAIPSTATWGVCYVLKKLNR
ncbi:class I SAM-dependent methyltransferase [Pedobacter sp. Hv1]|uniref:class I SAM-dependent DNA methyltransferase n=1 Tax=Pedobacter sp. Hv1 TaxID=1740090 RepID=UPI0006D89165|nr:class I SAM-dependent methyltransferase [Pedobacter sp. Hv1]KQC02421.1 hypothetical protein AQF98_02245 [Pedobacter sp. Hv1]